MSPHSDSSTPVNPNEYLKIPAWINEDYFQPIIQKDVPNFVSIKRFTPIAATAPGENYTSIMVRVIVDIQLKDGSEQQVSYILKTMLEAGGGADAVSGMGLFPKERQMYERHMPSFDKLFKEAGLDVQLAPKCLHIEATPERITLVLEDLKRQSFRNADRLQGFDMQHMRCTLRKLAELHAVSAVNYELNGRYEKMFEDSMYSESNWKLFEGVSLKRDELFKAAMRQWGLPDVEKYIEQMPTPKEGFLATRDLNIINENEFNVLNHGDCWANNIMFNYKPNGEVDKTLFVDLQVSKWGSPAQDLWYFITTSAALDIKVKEFDHFIYIYHQRLVECLKLLNYQKRMPTLKDIHVMMIKYGYWGPVTAQFILVVVVLPSDKDSNITNLLAQGPEADEIRMRSFINPLYVKAMLQLYPFFENKGCFCLDVPQN